MSIRLMTSNLWGEYFQNPVEPRAVLLEKVFRRYQPDILGLQEAMSSWQESSLFKTLQKDYEMVPVESFGMMNHTPLFYRKDRVKLLSAQWYLYHPALDSSKGFTCGVFEEISTGKPFAVFCTHFWWQTGIKDDVIRHYNAKDLVYAMREVAGEYEGPAFFMGDLNCTVSEPAWEYLHEQGWESSFECAELCSEVKSFHGDPVKDDRGHFHGTLAAGPKEDSIDHIGIQLGVKVLCHTAVTDQEALDASDHCPVFADITL